jgi:hypothetical protein
MRIFFLPGQVDEKRTTTQWNRQMLVSVEPWSRMAHDGSEIEFVAVQLEHFGFMLSRCQAEEYCRKLSELREGGTCHTDASDTLFMDIDTTTSDLPFVILATSHDAPHTGWFCDIPEPAANELFDKLKDRLRSRDGEMRSAVI